MGKGATKREGGRQVKFSPYKKGVDKDLAMLNGGTKSCEVVLIQEREVLAIVIWGGGGCKKVSTL